MQTKLLLATAAAAFALLATAASADTPPPGATALCRDGTYSFSQTHSGTCSHHGGVAQWLDSTTTTTTTATTSEPTPTTTAATSTTAPPTTPASTVSVTSTFVGQTVLLANRTKTSACHIGRLPDRRCSPGAYYSKLTTSVICSSSFRTGPIRNVPDAEKHAVEVEYGLAPRAYGSTLEIDHIVSLELGGSNDIANLYPEKAKPRPGFHEKDRLENLLHERVCSGRISLAAARRQIASDWVRLYKRTFR
jgi:hypothetical protein